MTTAGEAAALFGSTDSASDLFALPSLDNEPDTRSFPPGDELFAAQEPSAATDLFGSSVDQSSYFSSVATHSSENSNGYPQPDHTWSTPPTQSADYRTSAASTANGGHRGYANQSVAKDWSDQQGQWPAYEPQQYQPQANGTYSTYSQTTSTQYDHYAPPTASYETPAPAAQATTYGSSSGYGSYARNAYESTPANSAVSQSAYDPYKPSQFAAVAPPVPAQPYSTYSHVPETANIAIPQVPTIPPAPASIPEPPEPRRSTTPAAAYRPKTLNAYDPPLPPPKPAPRRASARQASHPSLQPAYASAGIPGYSQGVNHRATPPPPPPPRASTASLPPPPSRANTSSLPPPPPRGGSALRHFVTPPPPAPYQQHAAPPSDPYQQHVAQLADPYHQHVAPPVDPYASPPRPQPSSHLHDSFASPPMRASTVSPLGQPNYVGGHRGSHAQVRSYGPTRQWTDHGDATAGRYDGLPTPSLAEDEATDIQRVYGAEPSHTKDPYVSEHQSVGDAAWHQPPVASSALNAELHASSGPLPDTKEEADVEDIEGTWNPTDPEGDYEEHAWAENGRDKSLLTSPKAQPSQRISSPTSSNGLSSASVAHDPYKPNGAPAQDSPPRARALSPDRAKSPGSSSVKSWTSSQRRSLDQSANSVAPPPPPARSIQQSPVNIHRSPAARPYEPPPAVLSQTITGQRTASPSSFSVRSVNSVHSVHSAQSAHSVNSAHSVHSESRRSSAAQDPYVPVNHVAGSSTVRDRSTSSGSAYSPVIDDPYAPRQPRQQTLEAPAYGSFSAIQPYMDHNAPVVPAAALSQSQVLTLAPTVTPYAPSPSLLGTNDPLGRTSARVPVISFGFGGKLVSCFHNAPGLSTGFDVAMSSRTTTDIQIRPLCKVIPQSALDTSAASYPGPLFSDPGTPTTTLVRTGAATQTKTKKARVIKYLEDRAEEISRGLGYLHPGSMEGHRAEAKRALINLLKVLVDNDGRLSGSSQIDTAVRAALLPDLDMSSDQSGEILRTPALGFTTPGDALHLSDANDAVVAVHTLRASHLEKIQQFLLRGDRQAAFQYAADEKLWAHAMVIASSIDKESWKDVVNEFVRSELASKAPADAKTFGKTLETKPVVTGKESLRVAYSLFAGHGSAAVQELLPPKSLTSLAVHPVPVPATANSTITPMTPNFPPAFQTSPVPTETLSQWAETVAMMINSPMSTETSSALTALGDQLAANGWFEAAHSCYLLSPQTSPVGGMGAPTVRVVLYGAPSPHVKPNFWKDPDPIIFSEIVEFALSLTPPTKGQEAFPGVPHLQPYRLIRAAALAEMGHVQIANRYCEAISNSLTRHSPYLNATFIEQLRGLADRLVAAPLVDKSGSWIASKMARPSLDKIGNWLEGRFTSFIAGDNEQPKPEETRGHEHTFSGPFAHYSTISSTTSSTMPSPQMSTTNLTEMHSASLPARTGSAMALRSGSGNYNQIARASSAVDYLRRKPSPVPRVSSASATAADFADAPWGHSQIANGYAPIPETTPKAERTSSLAELRVEEEETVSETPAGPQMGSWWGAPDSGSGAPTPTASSFDHSESLAPSTDGFISLMDAPSFSAPTSISQSSSSSGKPASYQYDDDEDDELGLGNSGNRRKTIDEEPKKESPKAVVEDSTPEPSKESAASSGGWLSRLWKRGDSTSPGPVKANLGEQSAFYYDKELKRWVNKNTPPEATKPPATAPPPRAQTVSPAASAPRVPPGRPATAIDLTDGPPRKPPMRVRSNLVPSETASAPTTPFSATPYSATPPPSGPPRAASTSMDPPGLDGPPSAGARSRPHAKRNARSRYVDVFQQESS